MSLPHSSAELVWSMRAGGGCAWNTGQQERGHEGKGLGGGCVLRDGGGGEYGWGGRWRVGGEF